MPLRRTMRALFLGAALAVTAGCEAAALTDSRGLKFVSQDAFCAYHCSAAHVAQAYRHLSETSECLESNCGRFLEEENHHYSNSNTKSRSRTRRRLRPAFSFSDSNATNQSAVVGDVHAASEDDKDVTIISVVSCASVTDVTLSIGDPETDAFANFYQAFSTAYDAMLSGSNATYDACQLQFLQKELLANYSTGVDDDDTDVMEIKPTLIKLNATSDELKCLKEIKEIWPASSESHTPFLTRSDQDDAAATVMLVHVNAGVGDNILALECVESVTVLPAILKLMPFAKSSYAFSKSKKAKEGPALEIRLAKVVDTAATLKKLSARVTKATGIKNLLTKKSSTAETGGVLIQAAVDDYDTWTQALAIVLDDEAVEWVDLQQVVTTGSLQALKTPALEQRMLRQRFIEEREMKMEHTSRRLDDYAQDLVGVNIMQKHNITGSSIIVGITDTGLYIDHDQFDQESRNMYDDEDLTARKVIYYQTFANNVDEAEGVTCGHGTHVSGILAGSSYSKKNSDLGIASSARIAFMDIGKQESTCAGTSGCDVSLETPGEVTNLMKAQVTTGAKIFSFSWGTGANDYNTQTQQVDEFIYDNPDILIVVAAGNSGESGDYTISSPSGAKNVISVGASLNAAASFSSTPCQSVLNENTVASFSSIGPTLDGRQKPDIVAPGMSITSSQSEKPGSTTKSSAVCSLQGTSQATPVVAGMAVLIYEWLRDGWWKNGVPDPTYGMDTIPASLIKALLLHSGEAMSRRLIEPSTGVTSCVALETAAKTLNSYPDFNQGYGKPTMLNLVSFMDDNNSSSASSTSSNTIYFFPNSSAGSEPSVTEGSEVTFHFMLTASVNLRVTIAWTDPPGSVGSKATLQNDLDLMLKVANTSAIFYPLSGNGSRDAVNNVEMVEVSYDDVLDAVTEAGMVVEDGYIYVQAVVRGHSVKAGENATTTGQKFSIVASSTPSSTSLSSGANGDEEFWQPWMTIGAIVICTLLMLFVIALIWRMRVTKKAENLKADHSTPSAAAALTGAAGKRTLSRRERNKKALEESQQHIHPNYRNVDAGGSHRPAIEHTLQEPVSRRGAGAGGFNPAAAAAREPSRRGAAPLEPPHPPSVRKTSRRAAAALQQPVPGSRRRDRERGDGRERKRSDGNDRERKRSDGSDRERKRSERRWERERSDRAERPDRPNSDRGRQRERSARKNEPAKAHSTRRSKPPIVLYE
ncbi:subtilisin serine protease [Phytophthora sojae]|uniref:subtilisin n=1 Tax=Phytophthora sojae (strain P6497) TaxID=1094619 RepID=G4YZ31_PHYSP|nr:subtilisin serine protease [Phytophthora sojae]EGZ23312.1 subtilisin serine protease [Phytophthora sojae]|eukprot:XP_009518600.1 subtilisin serine protease [Phytophthora sojae]